MLSFTKSSGGPRPLRCSVICNSSTLCSVSVIIVCVCSSTALPCGTSGSPLASPRTPSFLQKGEEAYGNDHPFPLPEEEGELLRERLCRDIATPYSFLEEGGRPLTIATLLLFQKREDVYDHDDPFFYWKRDGVYEHDHPSPFSRRGKRSLTKTTPFFQKREDVYDHSDHSDHLFKLFSRR